jgi:hypothetical protein
MRLIGPLRVATAVAAAFLLSGCPAPNTYTTPRTLDRGDLQLQAAVEGFGASFHQQVPNAVIGTHTETVTAFTPLTPPTLGVRYGVAEGFELGARLANLASLALDAKVRLLKGTFDLAIDPGLQAYHLSVAGTDPSNLPVSQDAFILYLHAPLLVGYNFSEAVSLVLSPGFTYGLATKQINVGSNAEQAQGASGVMARIGVGVDIRVSKKFAIHPEVTILKSFTDSEALLYLFGVGFNFGAQPNYSDLHAAAPSEAPAKAKKEQ